MRLLIFISIVGLGHSMDLGAVFDIDELIGFITGAGNRLSEAADELNDVEIEGTKKYAEVVDTYLVQVLHSDEDDEKYRKLKDLVEKIDQVWDDLGTKDPGDDDKTQLEDLAKTREELYDFYVGNVTSDGLPGEIAYALVPQLCDFVMPEQLRLKRIHQAVALSELRAFILGLKAGDDNQKAVAKAVMQSEEYILASRLGFRRTEDRLRACDPPEHIRGKTFGEFLGFVQGVHLNDGHTPNHGYLLECGDSCTELNDLRIDRCYEKKVWLDTVPYCHVKKCLGKLDDCIEAGSSVGCELPATSDRRYSWVKSYMYQGPTWGKADSCQGKQVDLMLKNLGLGKYCHTCLCVCVEDDIESTATRTFSLLPQFADIQKNKVVTGIRFQEKKKMFHVQIEESTLGPFGDIVPGTSKWKKLNSFSFDKKTGIYKMNTGIRTRQLFDDFDYKKLTKDSRFVNIDKVRTPFGEVMVGVRLVYNDDQNAIEIEILSWPFDFKTGELKNPVKLDDEEMDHDWINWQNTPRRPDTYNNERTFITMNNLDDPVLAAKNPILSDPNDRIMIRATGYKQDMAQHTIPYLILRDVAYSDKKAPLGGLEIYYARAKGFGGFLGFRIQGYDLTSIFQHKMNQEDIDKYQPDFDGSLPKEIPVKEM